MELQEDLAIFRFEEDIGLLNLDSKLTQKKDCLKLAKHFEI